jgi:peptidyl-prolyl cis-trans isomerase SurA
VVAETFKKRMTRGRGWRRTILVGAFSALIFVVGCADNADPSLKERKSRRIAYQQAGQAGVLVVGGETITYEDVISTPMEYNQMIMSLAEFLSPVARTSDYEQFRKWAGPQVEEIVTGRISQILLYQEAKRQAGDNIDEALEQAAEKEMRRFILRYGGDEAKAEQALREIGMDRQSFKEQQKRLMLRQSYIASKLPGSKPISYRELMQRYNEIKEKSFAIPAQLKFRLIDIQPAKLELANVEQDRLEEARKLAEELIGRIKQGEDFGELARQYSQGHRRELGGSWNPVNPDSLAEPYDVLAEAAKKIEPGHIAGPIEVQGHIFIMQLQERRAKDYEPFENVQDQVEQQIIIERQREAIDKLVAELIEQAALEGRDEFVDFCLEMIYRMSKR